MKQNEREILELQLLCEIREMLGGGGVFLLKANNLSDVASVSTAVSNLGLGAGDSPTFTGVTLSGKTEGSVLFTGPGGVVSEDNPAFIYDDTNNRLTVPFLAIGAATSSRPGLGFSGTTLQARLGDNSALTHLEASRYTATGGTVTASTLLFSGTQTWNNAGVTFAAFRINVTSTAAASGSHLMDLQTGGSIRLRVFSDSAQGVQIGTSGFLINETGNTMAQRNSTSAQEFRVYNTWTDAANNEYLRFAWTSNIMRIAAAFNGTGVARPIELQTNNNTQLRISSAVNFFVCIGSETSSFPALKRSSATIHVRLADDSAFTDIQALGGLFNGKITAGGVATANQVTQILQGSATIDPANLLAATTALLGTITVTGAVAGDPCFVSWPDSWASTNMILKASTGTNVINLYGTNPNTVTAIDLPSATIKGTVMKQ